MDERRYLSEEDARLLRREVEDALAVGETVIPVRVVDVRALLDEIRVARSRRTGIYPLLEEED